MEFRGIVSLDPHIADLLSRYLAEKESELCLKIIHSIHPSLEKKPIPSPPLKSKIDLTLSEAVLIFGKKVRQFTLDRQLILPKNLEDDVALEINQLCWNYLELLENSVTDLFNQIDIQKSSNWDEHLLDVVHSIKLTLVYHLDELEWALKRLDEQIKLLRNQNVEQGFLSKLNNLMTFYKSNLDRQILVNLNKCRKYLSFHEAQFQDEFIHYQSLQKDVKKQLIKLIGYDVLEGLDFDTKEIFKKIYEYLKMWEINSRSKLIPNEDIEIPLKSLNDPRRISHIFEEYHHALEKKLFEVSWSMKLDKIKILCDETIKSNVMNSLDVLSKEIHLLGSVVTKYRDFLLETDSDYYVRSRFGFTEWLVGNESAVTKNMTLLNYDIEETNRYVDQMIESLTHATKNDGALELNQSYKKIEQYHHEMSQPLISESTMRDLAEKALDELKHLKELTSLDLNVLTAVGFGLTKLIKHDWKYQVLFDIDEFETIYSIHTGILGARHEDRLHLNRLNEFRRLCIKIKELAKNHSFYKESQEMELSINDIKSSLQDFLGYVQRVIKENNHPPHLIQDIRFQLLEYRYYFSHYFYELKKSEVDAKIIRNKLMFVDPYLDSVENLINET